MDIDIQIKKAEFIYPDLYWHILPLEAFMLKE